MQVPIGGTNIRVEELICADKGSWDIDKILKIFPQALASKIFNIVILLTDQPDKIKWGMEKRGHFIPEGSNTNRLGNFWKTLWKASVSNKMKIMTWRACHKCLPTMRQLLQKHITTDGICGICKEDKEDAFHAIFGCPDLRMLWQRLLPSFEVNKWVCSISRDHGYFWETQHLKA